MAPIWVRFGSALAAGISALRGGSRAPRGWGEFQHTDFEGPCYRLLAQGRAGFFRYVMAAPAELEAVRSAFPAAQPVDRFIHRLREFMEANPDEAAALQPPFDEMLDDVQELQRQRPEGVQLAWAVNE